MATVTLSEIYEAEVFNELMAEKETRKNAFIKSGVIVDSAELNEAAVGPGRTGDMPAWKPITKSEPNYSSDNNASFSTPDNIDSDLQKWRKAIMNNSWSAMNLSRELALSDPLDVITSQVAEYWDYVNQTRLVSSSLGILADNIANDSGDMLYNISIDTTAALTADNLVSAEAIIMAAATMGDRQNEFVAIAMHSTVYTRLKLNNLITVVEDSEANVKFERYQEMIVIVDDSLPAVQGTNKIIYTTILYKAGIFGMGKGSPTKPSELETKPSSGDGGGEEILYSRVTNIIHPWGFSFLSASVAGKSPTYAELATAANWNRIFARKNCGIAFLRTNG